jgi:hypothetical protein
MNNKKINPVVFSKKELEQINLMNNTNSNNKINEWINSQETNYDGLKYEWIGFGSEPPKNWLNHDISQINDFININNDTCENSITPGTNIIENKKYYLTYEDWFFDHYKPIHNEKSIKSLFNIIIDVLEKNDYNLINKNLFKNNLIEFIYKNSS